MHIIQEQLLALAETEDLGQSSYYSLARRLGVINHGSIKFHLDQLIKRGLLVRNLRTRSIVKVGNGEKFSGLISIPIMGEANCGEPTAYADDLLRGFLRVSPSLFTIKSPDGVFALKASGNSMNRAFINGHSIDNGDYILVQKGKDVKNGDYIVSIIDNAANVKRLLFDNEHRRIVLVSESTEFYPPIFIAEEDLASYYIAGKVMGVVKGIETAL